MRANVTGNRQTPEEALPQNVTDESILRGFQNGHVIFRDESPISVAGRRPSPGQTGQAQLTEPMDDQQEGAHHSDGIMALERRAVWRETGAHRKRIRGLFGEEEAGEEVSRLPLRVVQLDHERPVLSDAPRGDVEGEVEVDGAGHEGVVIEELLSINQVLDDDGQVSGAIRQTTCMRHSFVYTVLNTCIIYIFLDFWFYLYF